MNAWLLSAVALMFAQVPCGVLALRGDPLNRLVGVEMAGLIAVLQLMVLTEAMGNANFFDLPLCLAFLLFGGGLVFVRFLERWL